MLGLKEKEIDWLNFKKNDLPVITQDSNGNVVPILKMSYDYLSAPLKRCFAYCAVFPKACRIGKEILIGMWMAQELIQLDGTTRSFEDVGEQHFMDLLDRSFFEVDYFDVNSGIYIYKMHDLIHDLAQSLGGNEYYKYNLVSDANYIDKLTRHAWVPLHVTTNLLHARKLRTLVVRDSHDIDRHYINEIVSVFKQMRVLELEDLNITRVPHAVDGLRHLSYLNLTGNTFDILPESICSLYNLQTLILMFCSNLKELPTGTRNLVSLRHLDILFCQKLNHMPRGLDELTCLQTLSDFVMGPKGKKCCDLGELRSLVNLRGKLAIRNLRGSKVLKCTRDQSFHPDLLTQLKFVQHLELYWSTQQDDVVMEEERQFSLFESLRPHSDLEKLSIIGYEGKRFPSWMDTISIGVSLPNIVYMRLSGCKSWGHIPPLGLLPSLQELRLEMMNGIEFFFDKSSTPIASNQLFPSLKVLELCVMPKLRRLVGPTTTSCVSNSKNRHFPVLERLEIMQCPLFVADGSDEDEKQFLNLPSLCEECLTDMNTLPSWLQSLPQLQTLQLRSCHNIVTLPKWMGNLTSLQKLCLRACSSLASIPDCMQRLTSLQRLEIGHCGYLERRCKKETGEDWHKISHITNVEVHDRSWW